MSADYDADGNLLNIPIEGEVLTAEYDSKNRLTSLSKTNDLDGKEEELSSEVISSYGYNAENRRTSVTENGKITNFVVSPHANLDQVLMETDEEGNPTKYYVYGQGLISKEDSDGKLSVYHYDRRGSTIALTNAAGEVTNTYEYDIYGEILSAEGETDNRFLYNGKYGVQTDDSGLYHMRARYYNPDLKRFINRDVVQGSILEPQTFNRYAYVNGNPISYIDPFGLSREQDGNLLTGVWNFFIGDDLNTLMNPHASGLQRAFAGISLASNFIPGAGPAFKGFKVLTKGIGKGISNTFRSLPKFNRIAKGGIQCHCFTAGTTVLTEDGDKNIEDVQVGDRILAKDDKTGDIAYKEVLHLFQRVVTETYNIYVEGEEITTTDEHPFWVKDKGWVEAQNLTVKDKLLDKDGNELTIDDIIIKEEKVVVYNFEVADYHSYFVSDLGIWVHNACFNPLSPDSYLGVVNNTKKVSNSKRNGYALNKALEKSLNISRPKGNEIIKQWDAHHIVAAKVGRGKRYNEHIKGSHEILNAYGIDINSAANGVYLPRTVKKGVSKYRSSYTHQGSHVKDYHEEVFNRLNAIYLDDNHGKLSRKQDILNELHQIRIDLLTGSPNIRLHTFQ